VSAMPAGLRLGGAFLQLLGSVIIARSLGAESAGPFFFWSMIFMTCGQISTFGLDRLALQRVPRLGGDPAALERFLAPLRLTALLCALLLTIGVTCYAVFVQTEVQREVWWYLLAPACICGVALCMINGEVMAGMGRPMLAVFYRHTFNTTLFVTALLISASFLTPELALVYFSLAFLVAGFGALHGPGLRGGGKHFQIPGGSELRDHLSQGLPICLSLIFAALAYLVPLGILERTHPSESISYITTSFRLFLLFDVLSTAVHSLAMPDLSKSGHSGDFGKLWKVYRSSVVKGLIILGPPMVFTYFMADHVMGIFGEEFSREGASVLRMFLVFGIVSLMAGPATHLLLMVGKTKRMASYSFARMAISCVLSIILVPKYGPGAMALVFGAGILVEKALCLIRVRIAGGNANT